MPLLSFARQLPWRMLLVEERYYKLNRILLKMLGLWPYRNSRWENVQVVLITILCLSMIFVQFAVFITHDCTMDLVINVFSIVFPSIFALLIYLVYYFCSDTFKNIMEHIYYDWKTFKNRAEFDILDNYASTAKLITKVFFLCLLLWISVSMYVHIMPIFLDVVLPLNESRRKYAYIEVEYFLDPVKSDYLFTVHIVIFTVFGTFITLATGSALYSYSLHACAMFKIINYRMEMTMDKDTLRISSPERNRVILDRLVYAIVLHRRNLLYCDMLTLQLNRPFLAIIIIGVTSLSISLFRLLQAVMGHNDIVQIFIAFVLVIGHISYIFFGNHIGQQVTDNNAEIFNTVYNLPWYLFSLNIQKVILFLLQKGNKDIYLSAAGIFDASYECFSTLLTTATSYFTVIYTIH